MGPLLPPLLAGLQVATLLPPRLLHLLHLPSESFAHMTEFLIDQL